MLRIPIVALAVLLGLVPAAGAVQREVVLDPAASRVTFTLDTTFHEVHGTMALAGGAIRFDPETGSASGEVTVDARAAETGNRERDETMHAEVLETARFPTIRFRVERVEGRLAESGPSTLRMGGVLSLHGTDHPMTIPVTVETTGDEVRGKFSLSIPYVEWGLHDPSFFVARAAKTVDARVVAVGRLDTAGAAPE